MLVSVPFAAHLLNVTSVLSWRSVGNAICSISMPTLHGKE